ncbi:phosphoadenylyl-sulfate reductase [Primorskyibacter sp. S187A]|uniref:phosphoadenylyl-sulfate reductase n=1 Tax=Primorskyibacter sp. S187A TaxID=3415130 RepID=UPI003C7A98A2
MAQPHDVDHLNSTFRHHGAHAVLQEALSGRLGRIAMVSSFGADSVVLLHMVAIINRRAPVLFLDTGKLFAETLAYQMELAERLNLQNIRILSADAAELSREDPQGALHASDPNRCCALRKSRPLARGLAGFDGWITGRKRFQSAERSCLAHFERAAGQLKINPLAYWAPQDLNEYMEQNRLPRHPLVARGYPSLGCAPCTQPVRAGDDPRAGRWRGSNKTECGIHLPQTRDAKTGEFT